MTFTPEEPATNPRGRPPPEKLLEETYDLARSAAETSRKNANELIVVRTQLGSLSSMVKEAISPKSFPRSELRALVVVFAIAVLSYLAVNCNAVLQVAR